MYEPPTTASEPLVETSTLQVKTEFEEFCEEEIKNARSIAYAMNLKVTQQQTHMSLFLQFEGHETLKSKLFLLR